MPRAVHGALLALSGLLVASLSIVVAAPAQASMVGKPCSKAGATTGDGPGRTVVCQKRNGRLVWVLMTGSSSTGSEASCRKPVRFTRDIIDPASVQVVTPIGGQTGSGGVLAVRSYVHPRPALAGQRLPLFAPAPMTLVQASYYLPPGAPAGYQPEYSLYFDAGCGVQLQLFHIKGVVAPLSAAVPSNPSPSSAGQPVRPVKVKAGQQIGWYTVDPPSSVAFDVWVNDQRRTNDFITPSRFSGSNALHAVCPWDYYSGAQRQRWLALLGAPSSTPVPGTGCGGVTQGAAGTAHGMWFLPGATIDALTYDGPYQSQILLTTDPLGTVRIGGLNPVGAPTQMILPSNNPTWRDPATIRVGDTHCWSEAGRSVLVSVLDATRMRVVTASGDCGSLSLEAGRTYSR